MRWRGPISTPGNMSFSACTAWASRSTAGGRRRPSQSALPHLRASRLARDAARLSRAAPARKRRQHLLRQSHRRCFDADRGAVGRSRRRRERGRTRSARRIPKSLCRAISLARRAKIPPASTSPARRGSPSWRRACARARRSRGAPATRRQQSRDGRQSRRRRRCRRRRRLRRCARKSTAAIAAATPAWPAWRDAPPAKRADCLTAAAGAV